MIRLDECSNAKRPHFSSVSCFFSSLHSVLPQSSEASVILEITTLGKEIHKSTEEIWKQIISIQEYQGENAVFSHCSYSSLFSVCLLSVQCFLAGTLA